MSVNVDTIQFIAGLILGITAVPYAALFYTLYLVGRIVTKDEDRTRIGLWFGRFCLVMGIVMNCVAALYLGRWIDFDPDRAPQWFVTAVSVIGASALVAGIPIAIRLGPLVWREIAKVKGWER